MSQIDSRLMLDNNILFRDLDELIGNGTIEKHRILQYGFIPYKDEDSNVTYKIFINFLNGDLGIQVKINGDLTETETTVYDNQLGDEYVGFFDPKKQSTYLKAARAEYQNLVKNIAAECVRPEGVSYLVPEQRDFLEGKIDDYTYMMNKRQAILKSISDSQVVKHAAGNEGGGLSLVEDVGLECDEIEQLANDIDSLRETVEKSWLPEPRGEEVMIGSLVDYNIMVNGIEKSNSILIVEGPYDTATSRKTFGVGEDRVDFRFCSADSSLGLALLGKTAGSHFISSNNRYGDIIGVNNQAIYQLYPEEYIKMETAKTARIEAQSGETISSDSHGSLAKKMS